MKRNEKTGSVDVALVLLLLLVTSFAYIQVPSASGVPTVVDLGDGNKTVSWDFSDPSDYNASNVTLAGRAELSQTSGSLIQDSDADFNTNGTLDTANLTVSGGSIVTRQQSVNLVLNGSFLNNEPWRFGNSPSGNITARWDLSNFSAAFLHGRPPTAGISFDEMDSGVPGTWIGENGGALNPKHTVTLVALDTTVFIEPTASIRMDVNFKQIITNWVALCRVGSWNWAAYNTIAAWMNMSFATQLNMSGYVYLQNGTFTYNTSRIPVAPGWKEYRFDISGFGPRLGGVTKICFNFTNVANANPVYIWIDDIWLHRSEKMDEMASVSQLITKGSYTDPTPGTVLLSFRYMFEVSGVYTNANLLGLIDGSPIFPPIPSTSPLGWTPASYDISSLLTDTGTFNLSFVQRIAFDTSSATYLRAQIDDVMLTIPTYRGGVYRSIAFDLWRTYFFDTVSWSSSSHPDTNFTIEVRAGHSSNTMDGSWTPWEVHYVQPEPFLLGRTGSFLQYRVILTTTNSSASMSFNFISFTFHRYMDSGTIETLDFTPTEQLIGWRQFLANTNVPTSTSVTFEASVDSGTSWYPITSGSSLSALVGPCVRLRADLSTLNTTQTPWLQTLNVTYEYLGTVSTVAVTPASWAGSADDQQQFTALGKDQFGHIAPITPVWTTDDPAGSVDVSGLYRAGAVGSWHVCATSSPGGPIDCANVTVSVGIMTAVVVIPAAVSLSTGDFQNFTAIGQDSDGNLIQLSATRWSTDVGTFEQVTSSYAHFRARGTPASGRVTATEGLFSDQASVTVTADLQIQGTVPNQQKTEDSPPWSLDLSGYIPSGQSPNDLMWRLDDIDENLFTVFGDRRFGQHTLTFTLKPDAFGTNQVVLTLQNRTGARDAQQLTIDIAPVNDLPRLFGMPPIKIRNGVFYNFEYTSYAYDVDNPKSSLVLTTNDVSHSSVSGLAVTYHYESNYIGQTIPVILRISDGHLLSEAVHPITVTDENPPIPGIPLPDLTMYEDEVLNDAFPSDMSSYFNDIDGDTLQYSYSASHLTAEFWPTPSGMANVRLIPDSNWFGSDELTIRARDPSGALVEQTAVVTVTPINDPPYIDWQEDIYVDYDVPYDLDLYRYIGDVDHPQTSLSMTVNRTDIATVVDFSIHFMIPRYLYVAETTIPFSIRVGDGQVYTWANITVRVGDDKPPALRPNVSLPYVTFMEDQSANNVFDLDDYFEDSDGPLQISYTHVASTVIVSKAANNSLSFSAPLNWFGQDLVLVKASDGVALQVAHFTVRVLPVNDAPVLSTIPNQDMGTGGVRAIDLRPYVIDVDNNITTLVFTTSSSRAVVVGYTLILDYTGGASSESVTLTVNDTLSQTAVSFSVIVNSVPPDNGGDGEPEPNPLWPWGLLILLVIPLIVALAFTRMKGKRSTFDDVFMISANGRLMMHSSNKHKIEMDQDQLTNTLTTIAAFIMEGFRKEGGDLRQFKMDGKQILINRGHYFYLVATFTDQPPEKAGDSLEAIKEEMEEEFADVLHDWTGSAHEISVLKPFIDAYVARGKYEKGDWKKHS